MEPVSFHMRPFVSAGPKSPLSFNSYPSFIPQLWPTSHSLVSTGSPLKLTPITPSPSPTLHLTRLEMQSRNSRRD